MPVEFRNVSCPPITAIDISAPDGVAIGVIGEDGSGTSTLLRLAAGIEPPRSGAVAVGTRRRFLGPGDPLNFSPVDTLLLDHTLSLHDQLVRARAITSSTACARPAPQFCLQPTRKNCCWSWPTRSGGWVRPADRPRRSRLKRSMRIAHISAERVRAWGQSIQLHSLPGCGRVMGARRFSAWKSPVQDGKPTGVLRSGEAAVVRVSVQFQQSRGRPGRLAS